MFKYLFIWNLIMTEDETQENKIQNPLVHFPNGLQELGLGQADAWSLELHPCVPLSHVSQGSKYWATIHWFLDPLVGRWIIHDAAETLVLQQKDASVTDDGLTHSATTSSFTIFNFQKLAYHDPT